MKNLNDKIDDIIEFIENNSTYVQTLYEDEQGKHYGEIECIYDDDLLTLIGMIEDLERI